MLPLVSGVLEMIFGTDSLIMEATPREFLFDGVTFCSRAGITDPDILMILDAVCDTIAENAPPTIKENVDGSLRFSLYGHVSEEEDGW